MNLLTTLVLISAYIGSIRASPFDITDRYVNSYKEGIHDLEKEGDHLHKQRTFDEYKDVEIVHDPHEYDFIVIGGGTSGAVIASRLSEVPEYKVLLLEAGEDETKITKIPAMAHTLKHSRHTWGYMTEPQTTWCLGMENHQCHVVSGKILGGTSAINDMIYTRGNARDFDLWADKDNKQWCYDDLLPYFKKSEDAHLHHFDRKYHNQGGLLHVEEHKHLANLSESFLEAGHELGKKTVDYNGKDQMGFALPQVNIKDGVRQSSNEAYIKHFGERKNLIVKLNSHVVQIVISEHTKEAAGVKYVCEGKLVFARVSKEIVLAGGAINSAQILLLSGIGPKAELDKLHIENVKDLPVGVHLKDHPTFIGLNYFYHLEEEHHHHEHDLENYLRYGTGPLSSNGIEGLAFLKTESSKDTAHYPDIYLTFVPHPKTHEQEANFDIKITATHPKSSGSVQLKSKDPLHHPKIDLNHLSDEDDHDIATLLSGIRLAQKLVETEAFKKLGAKLNEHAVEGCAEHKFNSDEYWKCAIRHMSVSAGHYTGTCAMGTDPHKSVVDNKLRVHGLHKLRVADGSVIPISITGHTQAANVVIGEKVADMIRHDWK